MIYSGRTPYGTNQVQSSSLAITVENTDVAVFTTGSLLVSGSLTSLGGFTGSFSGSFTGSANLTTLTSSNALVTGNVVVLGTASINTLIINQTQLSTGSNQLGDNVDDFQTLYGTVRIPTGSFTVTGSVFITGSTVSLEGGSFSGSGANLFNIPASGITGLNLSQIATGSVTASVSPGTGSFRITSGSTNLLFVSSSGQVGIGVTNPTGSLTTNGNIQINNNGGLTFYNANSIFSSHYITTSNEVLTATSYNGFGAWKFNGYNVSIAKNLAVGTTLTDFVTPSQTFLVSGSTVLRGNTVISGSATNSLLVRGSGATSATNAFTVLNSIGNSMLTVGDAGAITATQGDLTTNGVYALGLYARVNQNIAISAPWADSTNVTIDVIANKAQVLIVRPNANLTLTSGTHDTQRITHTFAPTSGTSVVNALTLNQTINQTGGANGITRGLYVNPTLTAAADFRAIETTSGSVIFNGGRVSISGSAGTGSALTVYKSGSTVVSIQGSQGELFSITDSLSGSLFSVSNISGLPILEVFSDNTTLIGNYLDPMLVTTQLVTANSGSTVIYSLPTASYDGAFYDYVVRSGSNSRAGQIMAIWSGSSVNYTDNSTTDFGSTANLSFNVIVSGSNMVLSSTVTTGSWTVKTIIRSI